MGTQHNEYFMDKQKIRRKINIIILLIFICSIITTTLDRIKYFWKSSAALVYVLRRHIANYVTIFLSVLDDISVNFQKNKPYSVTALNLKFFS